MYRTVHLNGEILCYSICYKHVSIYMLQTWLGFKLLIKKASLTKCNFLHFVCANWYFIVPNVTFIKDAVYMVICHFYPFKPLGLVNPTIFLLTSILVAYVLFVIAPFNQLIKNKRVFAHPCLLLSSFGKLTVFVTINLKSKCCIYYSSVSNRTKWLKWNKNLKLYESHQKRMKKRNS